MANPSSLFFTLAVIDFESKRADPKGSGDYYNMCRSCEETFGAGCSVAEERSWVYANSSLYRLWHVIWRVSPNFYFWDHLLSKIMGGHITIGNFTVFGYNGGRFGHCLRMRSGTIEFYPPSTFPIGSRLTLGAVRFIPKASKQDTGRSEKASAK